MRPEEAIQKLIDFLPQLGTLDPHASSLSGVIGPSGGRGGSRNQSIHEYFVKAPLEWKSRELEPEVWSLLNALNYSGKEWHNL